MFKMAWGEASLSRWGQNYPTIRPSRRRISGSFSITLLDFTLEFVRFYND